MNALYLEPTKYTPKVSYSKEDGLFYMSGRSLPENAELFYRKIMDWFNLYINEPNQTTVLTFEMEYFNSATSKYIFDIICMMHDITKQGLEVCVHWCYPEEDEDIMEAGEIFENLSNIPFVFKELAG